MEKIEKRGRKKKPLPENVPLSARKVQELMNYLGATSDRGFGEPIGVSYTTVRFWRTGKREPDKRDKIAMAHVYDVPEDWWDQPGIPIERAIGKREKGRTSAEPTRGEYQMSDDPTEGAYEDEVPIYKKREILPRLDLRALSSNLDALAQDLHTMQTSINKALGEEALGEEAQVGEAQMGEAQMGEDGMSADTDKNNGTSSQKDHRRG